jgi:hypothetical protein
MRFRVFEFTSGLFLRARETVAWDTPARWAISNEVVLPEPIIFTGNPPVHRLNVIGKHDTT